jgi:hypothetical protein
MKTLINITFSYEGEPHEYEYLAPCVLPDDVIQLVAEGLLFEANWAGDSQFDDYTVTTTLLNDEDEVL